MKTVKLSKLFNIETGGDMLLQDEEKGEIPVVALGFKNNGIVEYIKENPKHKKYSSDCITVAGWAGGLKAFVQDKSFYVKGRVKILTPKINLTFNEKMYYCLCLNANAYKFAYGRKASSDRLSEILLPDRSEIPDWVYKVEDSDLSEYKEPFNDSPTPELNTNSWKEFKYADIFDTITIGKSIDLNKLEEGDINYVGRTEENNGITAKVAKYNDQEPYEGNCITVPMVGNALKSTYQSEPFYVSQNILILRSKNLNKYNAMFFNAIIRMDEFRFCYGRPLSLDRFKALTIKLPATPEGEPDYQFMEDYIKTLPYSKNI